VFWKASDDYAHTIAATIFAKPGEYIKMIVNIKRRSKIPEKDREI